MTGVPVIVFERETMSHSGVKSQVLKFLPTWYPTDLDQYLAERDGEVTCIHVHSGDLEGEADWDSADFLENPNLCSRATIFGDYRHLREDFSVVGESARLSVAYLLSLVVRGVKTIGKVSVLAVDMTVLE